MAKNEYASRGDSDSPLATRGNADPKALDALNGFRRSLVALSPGAG